MNVVHLNKHEATGGAAVAAKRLHEGLLDIGIDSEMLVERMATDDPTVRSRSRLPLGSSSIARYLLDTAYHRNANGFSTGLIPSRVSRALSSHSADIAHLHWVGDGFLSIADIGRINLPIVWTLHDMWAVTGGCHYPDGCDRYRDRCGSCPVLESESNSDLSAKIHRLKRERWAEAEMHFVAPSNWIAKQATATSVFSDLSVTVIPNGLDTARYAPNVDGSGPDESDCTRILFGAMSTTSDRRKGYDLLRNALEELTDPDLYRCIVFGNDDPSLGDVDVPVESYGFLPESELIELYADCDVMVVPSRQESFGQTAVEALACGTPVVAFDATGPKDIVKHKTTGYLADPYSPTDLSEGIEWVTASVDRLETLSEAARDDAVARFDSDVVAGQYAEVYERVA